MRTTSSHTLTVPGPIAFCHQLLRELVKRGDVVVDATIGNGHDTLVLAELVGPDGLVYGFDVQQSAIQATSARLEAKGFEQRARLVNVGHEQAFALVDVHHRRSLRAVVFNLGFLPGGDKSVATEAGTTVAALSSLTPLIADGGLLLLVLYNGHTGSLDEIDAVLKWCGRLDPSQFLVASYGYVNRPNNPPFAIVVEKLAQ